MNPLYPRLLIPGTPGSPAHIAVCHDPAVYEALREPRITAAVYVPRWSAPVGEAFARLAALPVNPARDFEDKFRTTPAMLAASGALEDFAQDNIIRWMRPAFKPHAAEENRHVVQEVASAYVQFVRAAHKVLVPQGVRQPSSHFVLRTLDRHAGADTRLNPEQPANSLAHTDPGDMALFSIPEGTVLVDQTGLDLANLRQPQVHGQIHKSIVHRLPLTQLAGRLWQIPDGAFGMWRGEPHAQAQYHFFPAISRPVQRLRAFANP